MISTKILILGAGIAGLGAGYVLKKGEVDFLIVEARDRVGGRIFTEKVGKNKDIEFEAGAEWVGSNDKNILQLAKEFKLTLQDHTFYCDLLLDGEYKKHDEWGLDPVWEEKYQETLRHFRANPLQINKKLDRISWWQYLANMGASERDLAIKDLFDSTDFGESIRHTSAFCAFKEYAKVLHEDNMDFKFVGGNFVLPETLADFIGQEKILLNSRVDGIKQTKKRVIVTLKNGEEIVAENVICTLPASVLNKISWLPGLPKKKQEAIDALSYCRITKTAFLGDKKAVSQKKYSLLTDNLPQFLFHANHAEKNRKQDLVIAYTTAERSEVMATLKDEQKIALFQDCLPADFKKAKWRIVGEYNWAADPYVRGAFAFFNVGQKILMRKALNQKFQRVAFAGEHVAERQGYMEGALTSGMDAAEVFC